ncbi:MAG: D-alanine--D-alanine ligase [Actinomycetota bacterium]|nr:D-alanine--D-alanine ligase [Actinomycetota bacterium]
MDRVRIAVIFGGRSSEHHISCVSAGGILRALDPDVYEVIPIGITPAGHWVLQANDADRLSIEDGVLPSVDRDAPEVVLSVDPTAAGLTIYRPAGVPEVLGRVDVVFPVLHGPWGEDGTIQGLLELAGVPYVGSGVLGSALAMDKGFMNALFDQAGLPIGPYAVITDAQWRLDRDGALARARGLGEVVFVKPARAGSSNGITKVSDPGLLANAIEAARIHDPKVIIEKAIAGAREIECGVIVDGTPKASRCAEIIVHSGHEFYDFAAKYLDDSADLVVPADLTPELESKVQELAIAAFTALACEGLARVDFFVTAAGQIIVNEINTMPGFTPISMFPRMWEASGLPYPALVDHLVRDALLRGTGLR